MKKYLMILSVYYVAIGSANADCLDKLIPSFQANSITLNSNGKTYEVASSNGKTKCKVSPKALERFVSKNFIRYNADKSIVASWNYLAINKKQVYDYMKSLKDYSGDSFEDTTSYKLYGVVNNQFACYQYAYDSMVSGSAHPNNGTAYYCAYPGGQYPGDKNVKISQVIAAQDIINAVVKNKDVVAILKQSKVNPSSIKNLKQLYTALSKNEDMSCVLGSELPTTFAISNVNTNGTIDAIYSLGANAPHVCMAAAPSDIIIKNVKPLMQINRFVKPSDLTP